MMSLVGKLPSLETLLLLMQYMTMIKEMPVDQSIFTIKVLRPRNGYCNKS